MRGVVLLVRLLRHVRSGKLEIGVPNGGWLEIVFVGSKATLIRSRHAWVGVGAWVREELTNSKVAPCRLRSQADCIVVSAAVVLRSK